MKHQLLSLPLGALLLAGCAQQAAFVSPKLEILNKQVRSNPDDAQAHLNRGYTLAALGQREAARADLRRAVALKDNGPTHNSAGFSYFNLGDDADALHEWTTAADLSQRRARYDYYCLALGHWVTGDRKQALENYQLAVERDPRFGGAKTLFERTEEWTPRERRVIHEIYVAWSKGWRP